MDDPQDFMDNYMSGRYDVACKCCHDGKVKVYHEPADSAPDEIKQAYESRAYQEERRGRSWWHGDPEAEAERRFGC